MRKRCGTLLGALGLAVACGDSSDDSYTTTTAPTTTVSTTATTMTSTGDGSGSSGDGDTSTTGDPTTGAPTTSAEVTGDVTTGGGAQPCDPQMAPFLMPDGELVAAIRIDFDAGTCAASSSAGDPPQILFEVQPTGLVDAVLIGLEIVDVSSGHIFQDSPLGDSEVADLASDLTIRFDATRVEDGAPVSITFQIFSTGPTLLDVTAEFG